MSNPTSRQREPLSPSQRTCEVLLCYCFPIEKMPFILMAFQERKKLSLLPISPQQVAHLPSQRGPSPKPHLNKNRGVYHFSPKALAKTGQNQWKTPSVLKTGTQNGRLNKQKFTEVWPSHNMLIYRWETVNTLQQTHAEVKDKVQKLVSIKIFIPLIDINKCVASHSIGI